MPTQRPENPAASEAPPRAQPRVPPPVAPSPVGIPCGMRIYTSAARLELDTTQLLPARPNPLPARHPARSPTTSSKQRIFSPSREVVMMSGGVSGMESSSSSSSGSSSGASAAGVAPFVAKTYGMVDDRATDAVVAWGPAGNSFVVGDPFAFSQALLPAHFKHANFSSFVRQFNTYGFRKVDPDRWEFAHASFLRGQTHLLRHILRRSSATGGKRAKDKDEDEDGSSTMLAMEVVRLRNEQRATEERVAAMWRRVRETERRPKQMLAFLLKVVGDPDVLRRLAGSGQEEGARVNRRRLLLDGGREEQGMPVDGLSYHNHGNLNLGEDLVAEHSVDLYFAGGGGVQADGGGGQPPYAFHVDSGY